MTTEVDSPFVTPMGFIARYFDNLKKCSTAIEAYELTEEQYKQQYGINKYASYDSFRRIKNRQFKKN